MNAHEQVINKQVVHLMKTLGCTEAEAIQIIKDDEAIDNGEKLFEQTAEQKKASKAMTAAGGGKHKEKAKRERKPDADKHKLMAALFQATDGLGLKNYQNVTDTEFSFEFNGNQYSVRLIKHRPAK